MQKSKVYLNCNIFFDIIICENFEIFLQSNSEFAHYMSEGRRENV